jgi:general nucleoside transport system permease protein
MSALQQLFAGTMGGLAPILAAALGGLASEYVGVLNIALEGLIMAGGFAYIAVGSFYGPFAGIVAALLLPAALAYAQDAYARKARADAFVVGLSLNLLVPGVASVLSQLVFTTKGVVSAPALASPRLAQSLATLPLIGPLLFGHRLSEYLAFALVGFIFIALGATPFGLRARALGMNPDALELGGLRPGFIRGWAYALSGLACGASGLAMAAAIGAWVPGLSSGRGWIALVAVYLGAKRLTGTLLAALLFAFLLAAANQAQALRWLPAELVAALPYIITAVVVIVGAAMKNKGRNRA